MASRFPRYHRWLCIYPAAYRRKYGAQMVQTLADMLDGADSRRARIKIWLRVAADLPLSAAKAQIADTAGDMSSETPSFIKRTGLLIAALLLPFFAALAANGLSQTFEHHPLYHSWLWRMPVLDLWVMWLPGTALVLGLAACLIYTYTLRLRRSPARTPDIKRAWPAVLPSLVALGILFVLFFHDSAHCWQNPVRDVAHFHQTWQCTKDGFLGG